MARKSIAEIRKDEIIEAFFKVVAEKGFAKATIREVAAAAGCNHGMLHHYFENKEAIIEAAVEHVMTSYVAELMEGLANYEAAADRIRFLIGWFCDLERFSLEFSRAWMEFWVLSKSEPAVSAALRECYRDVRAIFARIIRDGIERGEFRDVDPGVAAHVILASLEGSTMLWVVDTEGTPVAEVGKEIEEMVAIYLLKKEG
jgi:AcrR family transcriptional regulator